MSPANEKPVYVYVLFDPREPGHARYIGVSVCPRDRLSSHISTAEKAKTYRANWVRKLLAENVRPSMAVIETATLENWPERERWWIAFYRERGHRLTNSHAGGWGCLEYREETIQKNRESQRRFLASQPTDYRSNITKKGHVTRKRNGTKIPKKSEETRQKLRAARMSKPAEWRKKTSEAALAARALMATPELYSEWARKAAASKKSNQKPKPKRICTADGCGRVVHCRSMCSLHYQRWNAERKRLANSTQN